jgi:hypothetical protein
MIEQLFGTAQIDVRQQRPQQSSRHQQPRASDQKAANGTYPFRFIPCVGRLYYCRPYQSIRNSSMCSLSGVPMPFSSVHRPILTMVKVYHEFRETAVSSVCASPLLQLRCVGSLYLRQTTDPPEVTALQNPPANPRPKRRLPRLAGLGKATLDRVGPRTRGRREMEDGGRQTRSVCVASGLRREARPGVV